MLIVADAHALGAVVVTWNRKHFRPLISREGGRPRSDFPQAGLLSFTRCRMDELRVIVEISHSGMMMF
jgi:hypothetical protein